MTHKFEIRDAKVVDIREGNDTPARVILTPWQDGWFLYGLKVDPDRRRQGLARKLMEFVLRNATKPIYLRPIPFDDKPLDVEGLMGFYKSLGFSGDNSINSEYEDEYVMTWYPAASRAFVVGLEL